MPSSVAVLPRFLRASARAFMALKILGSAYLIYLGLQALGFFQSRGKPRSEITPARAASPAGGWAPFRQGLLSNLFNPKIGVFFTSFIPQFVAPGDSIFARVLLLGAIFNAMGLLWLSGYALLVSRAGDILGRPHVKTAFEWLTGCVHGALVRSAQQGQRQAHHPHRTQQVDGDFVGRCLIGGRRFRRAFAL